jgi:colanic acid/amylovoran biosynthesis glycosyltransferase
MTVDPAVRPRAIAYLQSRYPALSMTFVLREVVQLRQLGFRIDVASINDADRAPDQLTAVERQESEQTYYVKAHGIAGALAAHADALLRRPAGWLRGWAMALRLAGTDPGRAVLNAMYLTEALMVGRWMRRRGLTHVHAHLGSQVASVALLTKQVFGCGLSITFHGPDEFFDVGGQYLSEKVALSDFAVCISDFARSQLQRLSAYAHWSKMFVARLGVDPQAFAPPPPREAGQPFEVLCIGRLTPAKGQHVLIDAVARLAAAGRDVRLRMVGAGPDRQALEQHVQALGLGSQVVFEGGVNQDRIRSMYERADCFCLPSFAEGIPVVLMEAMAMEIACVTTHICGIPELIRHEVDGLLVAPSNAEVLAAALARLIDEPALRRRLGAAGRQRVLAEYHLQDNVRKLGQLFAARLAG